MKRDITGVVVSSACIKKDWLRGLELMLKPEWQAPFL